MTEAKVYIYLHHQTQTNKHMKAINNITKEIVFVTYCHNRLGNLRMWVNGKFYKDKDFNKKFTFIKSN